MEFQSPVSGVQVLFVGSDSVAATLREKLAEVRAMGFELEHVANLTDALVLAEAENADALMLELPSEDEATLSLVTQARLAAPLLPTVIITHREDEDLSLRALRSGARGVLGPGELHPQRLVTTLGAALESNRIILQLNTARERARHLATHDPLTGLINRPLFQDRVVHALSAARRHRHGVAILWMDLDNFKAVNDALGHAAGDGLIRGLARRLTSCLRETDTAARIGGDEFAILITHLGDEHEAAAVAKKVIEALGEPIHFRTQSTRIRASIGIACFPRDAVESEELAKRANTALHYAKERGGNRFDFYRDDMNAVIQRRVAIEERLRTALQEEHFEVHYQPQFDLTRGRIIGAEALIRWRHSELGLVSPSHFLPVAEETGLIVPIGNWILHEACRQNAEWNRAGHRGLRISVNVASQQFLEPGFADSVRHALDASGLPPVSLELEITESSLLKDVDVTVNTLRRLKELGVRLAIDDFGTGYSALAYLKRLPIDVLKIDQSFIRTLATDPADATITETIVQLAAGLNLTTIAEGVETLEQLLLLGSYGCSRMQGYLFGRPAPAEVFAGWIDDPPFRWIHGDEAAGEKDGEDPSIDL
jgi:diguanylate cyclase (GGDEF)-like protein